MAAVANRNLNYYRSLPRVKSAGDNKPRPTAPVHVTGAQGVQSAVPQPLGSWTGTGDEWADYYRSLDPTTRASWLYTQRGNEQAQTDTNANIESAATSAASAGSRTGNKLRQGAADYLDTPAAQALKLYSSADYNAIPNDVTASMKASGSRAIQKANADAMGAAVNRVTRQGLDGGAIAAQLQAAAGFRASADQAFLNAETDRWQAGINTNVRQAATMELSKRDAVYADMMSAAASAEGQGDSLAAQIRARKTFFQPDYTEPLLEKHVSDLEELDRVTQERAQETIDLARDMWETEKGYYEDETERLEAEAELNTILDIASLFIDATPFLNAFFGRMGGLKFGGKQ